MTTKTDASRNIDIARARSLYRGDWDEGGTVAADLPREVAERLLEKLGWEYRPLAGSRFPCWVGPDGEGNWETDEALRIALAAEVG